MNTIPPRLHPYGLSKSVRPNTKSPSVRNDPLYQPKPLAAKPLNEMLSSACQALSICMMAIILLAVSTCLDLSPANAQDRADETTGPVTAAVFSSTDDVKMVFSFDQTPWQSVIDFFVEQSGLSLQEIDQPPPGSFTYKDSTPHTISEAMDILNQALLREGYTLVRNKQMLVLQRDAELNPRLIETVNPDDLETRGLYEIMRCIFDVKDVQELGIEDQVRNLVSQRNVGSLRSFPAANIIIVQETGIMLREIKSIIDRAKTEALGDKLVFKSYRMKHVDPETLLIAVRDLMDFDGDSNVSRDGAIKISVEPLGKDLRIRATEEVWQEFLQIALMVDVAPEKFEGTQFERPIIQTYQPLVGPELVFQVLQTNFEGREGVRMDQDPDTGTIVIMGRPADHDLADQILQEFARQSADYTMIQLQNADADDVLAKLEKFFRVSLDDTATDAPIMFADTIANQINVRGKPADVELVKQMVADMDSQTLFDSGPRTDTRFIDMSPDEAENMLGILPDIFPSTGRPNKIEIILPKDRQRFRNRTIMDRRGGYERENAPGERENPPSKDDELEQMMRELDNSGASLSQGAEYQFVSCPVSPGMFQEDEEVGQSSEEIERKRNYQAPPELESVPGANIEAKWTPEGLRLYSQDLDALDDLESLILNRLKKTSKAEALKMFPLEFRRVEDLKPLLERLFGLESGGGGGGGIGGAMGNVIGNAMGGPAGDLLGGMFGGDGGDSGGSGIELEGDVVLEMDVPLNFLIVSGATQTDLLTILDVLDILDRPNAPQEQDFVGQLYVIPIKYSDPLVIKELIENNLPDYIKSSGNAAAPQNAEANQARAMQQMMRGLVQGGRGGGQSKDPEEQKPKATLGIDERNRALILTGPEYIYEKVRKLVLLTDIPDPPSKRVIVSIEGFRGLKLQEAIVGMLGDKAIVVGDDGSTTSGTNGANSSAARRTSPRANTPGNTNDAREAARQQIQRALQQGGGMVFPGAPQGRGGGANRGGGGGRGGNRGGGGGRGGQNRGGNP